MSKANTTKAKKIYNIVSTVIIACIFVFLVVIVALMLVQRKSGADSEIFGYYMYNVVTDSMSGTIEAGDVILSKKVEDKNSLREGDIITFIAPSGPLKGNNITHRIVEVVYGEDGSISYLKTKGDNPNVKEDEWRLNPDDVKAKFVKKAAFIGGLRRFLTHWYGYVLLIALPLCIVGILVIVGFVQDKLSSERAKQAELSANDVQNLSDEQKQKLLEDLLKSQQGEDKEN